MVPAITGKTLKRAAAHVIGKTPHGEPERYKKKEGSLRESSLPFNIYGKWLKEDSPFG